MSIHVRRAAPALAATAITIFGSAALGLQVDNSEIQKILADWPEGPKRAAMRMIQKYGAPSEVTPQRMIWRNSGRFRKTTVTREEVPHHWPMMHTDFLEQEVSYRVPIEKFSELAAFDGSVIAERTRGTLAARCDREEMNLLALNLAQEIATGKKNAQEARIVYEEFVRGFQKGERPAYMLRLNFEIAAEGSGDPDRAVMVAPPPPDADDERAPAAGALPGVEPPRDEEKKPLRKPGDLERSPESDKEKELRPSLEKKPPSETPKKPEAERKPGGDKATGGEPTPPSEPQNK